MLNLILLFLWHVPLRKHCFVLYVQKRDIVCLIIFRLLDISNGRENEEILELANFLAPSVGIVAAEAGMVARIETTADTLQRTWGTYSSSLNIILVLHNRLVQVLGLSQLQQQHIGPIKECLLAQVHFCPFEVLPPTHGPALECFSPLGWLASSINLVQSATQLAADPTGQGPC